MGEPLEKKAERGGDAADPDGEQHLPLHPTAPAAQPGSCKPRGVGVFQGCCGAGALPQFPPTGTCLSRLTRLPCRCLPMKHDFSPLSPQGKDVPTRGADPQPSLPGGTAAAERDSSWAWARGIQLLLTGRPRLGHRAQWGVAGASGAPSVPGSKPRRRTWVALVLPAVFWQAEPAQPVPTDKVLVERPTVCLDAVNNPVTSEQPGQWHQERQGEVEGHGRKGKNAFSAPGTNNQHCNQHCDGTE